MTQKGWFGEIEVWYHPNGITNILSLKTLKKRHHVTYDSSDRDGVFKVHTSQRIVEFFPHESGLHYLDLKDHKEAGIALVTTIRENFEEYTKKQVEGAIKACHLQAMFGHLSRKDFKGIIVHGNLIANCPITPENISHIHQLFGEKLAGLRGKTVCRKPEQVVMDYVQIPRYVIQTSRYMTLTANVMYANKYLL